MGKYVQINKNLFLVEKEIEINLSKKVKEPTQHIWVYDRSYSMSGELSRLTKDLVAKAKEIPVGDTLSLGWFSGEGQHKFILKGFKITDEQDYSLLEKAIEKNNTPVSCTCFSEILVDSGEVIEDLSFISKRFSLVFFSDGYPVVSNYSKEIESIFSAIEKIEGKITSSCLVGYGNYYNRELMLDMAERLGGSLIHSEDIPHFSIALSDIIEKSSDNQPKVNYQFKDSKPTMGVIFSIDGGTLNLYKQREDGSIGYVPSSVGFNNVYYLTDKILGNEKEVIISQNHILRPCKETSLVSALYGVSCILNQKAKTDIALETISVLGDKYYIDLLSNSYTNAEYGNAENQLKDAMSSQKNRLLSDYDNKYLPDENAFCLLDLIELLQKDDKAHFYPYNPNFKYKRIGAASKVVGKYPEFEPEKNVKCKLSDLAWNESKLNLSLRAKIKGTVDLKKGFKEVGLNKTYPTHIYRNYTLVKDGFLNMNTLPVSMSKSSFDQIQKQGMLTGYTYEEGHIYDLPLKSIPVMNRAIAKGKTSANELAEKVLQQTHYEAMLKVYNNYESSLKEKVEAEDSLTADQKEFLEENGVTRNGFSPKTEKLDPVDYYYAKEFNISIKGLSTLPAVKDVKAKLASGKDLTPREKLMEPAISLYENCPINNPSDSVRLAWLQGEITKNKIELVKVRTEVQKTKFSVILGKKWFEEFSSREEKTLNYKGYDFTFDLKEVKVDF